MHITINNQSKGKDKEKGKVKRVEVLDALRGIAILGMIFQHTLFDLRAIFGLQISLLSNPFLEGLFAFGGVFFIFLAGISVQFSSRNLLRGLQLIGVGMLLTLVTALFFPRELIVFGILHFLGLAILIFGLLKSLLARVNQLLVCVVSMILFIVAYYVFTLNIRFEFFGSFLIGFPSREFWSADYFPLFPYIFAFLSGTGFGWYVANHKLPPLFYMIRVPVVGFVGKYSLWFYLFHQPVLLLILTAILFFIPK